MPYNPHVNSTCEWLNFKIQDQLKTISKEQKKNWPLCLLSLIFVYTATPHSTTGFQLYKHVFGHKVPTVIIINNK